MAIQVSGMQELRQFFHRVERFMFDGSREAAADGAQDLAKGYQKAIAGGLNAGGSPMMPLKKSTLEGPISRKNDSRIRGNLGNTPLHATGKTADSIGVTKIGSSEWEVSSKTAHGNKVLSSNATGAHKGDPPFAGDVKKARRDPLNVTEKQERTMEDAIVKVLDRMLNGR
jgi:hypothetical protein